MKSQQPPSALLISCISVLRRISFAYHVDQFWLSLLFTRLSAQRISTSTFIVNSHRKEADYFRQVLFFPLSPFADAMPKLELVIWLFYLVPCPQKLLLNILYKEIKTGLWWKIKTTPTSAFIKLCSVMIRDKWPQIPHTLSGNTLYPYSP